LLRSTTGARRELLSGCEAAFLAHGDVVRVLAGPPGLRRELYLAFHPDAARRVLAAGVANYRKDNAFYREVRRLFGDGLLTSQGTVWQWQRRFLQPLFTQRGVATYAAAMSEQVEVLGAEWRRRRVSVVDLDDAMSRLTLRVVCRVLFGADLDDAMPLVLSTFGPLAEAVDRRAATPVRAPLWWPASENRSGRRAQRALHQVCNDIIARRRRIGQGSPDDLVSLLLNARVEGVSLGDAEIRDQVLIFLLAGYETTSTALAHALHLLGRHPEAQRRVHDEAVSAVGTRVPSAQDVAALEYIPMVIKEALRLYPPAPLIGRRIVADDEICGYRISAGADLILAPWVIHRHPKFWDDPAAFDPERFAAGREKTRHRYAWLPFGGGPRVCIGQHFAMLEMSIALASLVRKFEFAANGEPAHTSRMMLRPAHGVPSLVTCRE
jgi:cytochrome P450